MLAAMQIAKICHEANRAYYEAIGEISDLPWNQLGSVEHNDIIYLVECTQAGAVLPLDKMTTEAHLFVAIVRALTPTPVLYFEGKAPEAIEILAPRA